MLKRLVKQRKHSRPLAKKRFKKQENIKRKWVTGNILQNGRFSATPGGLESLQFILMIILVILVIFHKLHQQHSERLSLQSSETKSHQQLNIKAFAFLNSCPKLIDVFI